VLNQSKEHECNSVIAGSFYVHVNNKVIEKKKIN